MFLFAHARLRPIRRKSLFAFLFFLLLLATQSLRAASVRGILTDTTGARVTGARVSLVMGGKAVATTVSSSDGSFQLLTGDTGHMFLMIGASGFRQLATPDFYAGKMDSIERNLVLEPEWSREAIVVTATGTPTPQTQTSEATSVLSALDLDLRSDLVSSLRLMPGTVVTQSGQRGAQSSLFVRGGNSVANKVLLDGVSVNDIGGNFDFGSLSTTAVESAEVYRGPNTSLFGSDAGSSVLSLTTPHGTTSFPSILFEADGGNLSTGREQLTVAGARNKIDYLGAFSWLQTNNDVDRDQYHVATTAANLGWSPTSTTQVRGTLHYGVSATGVPNAWDFYQVADNVTQKDQDLFVSASINNQTTTAFHNSFRYGLSRKREQYTQWKQSGMDIGDGYGNTFGNYVTISGANGYKASGQALLDYGGTYPYNNQLVSNRDQLIYQGDYQATQHLSALIGFHFEEERGLQNSPTYGSRTAVGRTNYDYLAAVHGDFKRRFYYTLGGSLEHYSLFGTQTSSHAGLSYFILKPRTGIFSGTRILFDYGDAVREATLTNETYSLYTFLVNNGYPDSVKQLHIGPLAAPTTRTYEGGLEQRFFSQRLVFRTSYFHNQFGKEIESVPARTLLTLVPGLTKDILGDKYTYNSSLSVNTQAFRAQGVETTVEAGIGRYLFMRGGYTYLDAVVQRSFTSDNEAGLTYNDNGTLIPLGAYTPLVGARPFRRPPHTGFFTTVFAEGKLTGVFTASFASHSDDSTFLSEMDTNYLNSLLLPNRNLDYGYAKLDLGGSYQMKKWLVLYTQGENLMNNQHIAPIGYPSLPFTVRSGVRILWGPGSGR